MRIFERVLFALFIAGSVAGAVSLTQRQFLLPDCLSWADAILIFLAASNVLLAMARRDGWRDALTSFAIIAVGSGAVATLGATTGRPFGPYEYTPFFGPRIAGVLPAALPLTWYIILASGHYLIFHWLKPASRRLTAIAVASWATLFDFVFEPFAACVKSYWVWQSPNIPPQNYLAWFLLAFLLARVAPWGRGPIDRFDPRPPTAAAAILILSIIGRITSRI